MPKVTKTPPAREEEIYAAYIACDNAAEVGRKFKMPESTVRGIVARLGGDALAETRRAIREEYAQRFMHKAMAVMETIDPRAFDSPFYAAKAVEALVRAAGVVLPKDGGGSSSEPQTIRVLVEREGDDPKPA